MIRGYSFYRGLCIWIPIMLLFWVLMFWCVNAFAEDMDYFYGVISTKLIKVSDIDGDRIVIDIPFKLYSQYYVSEGVHLTYSRDLKNEGKEILALIAVKKKDEQALKDWTGYIGDDFDSIKNGQVYQKHFPLTIGQERTTYTDLGVAIPYLGADKNNPARFAMWDK